MTLVMLAPFASGAEHQTLALCRALQERCQVTLLANDEFAHLIREDPFFRHYTKSLDVRAIGAAFPDAAVRTPSGAMQRALEYPQLQWRLCRLVRRLAPDVVHLVLAPSFFAYLPFFRTLGVPVVLTLAGEMRYVRHFYAVPKRLAVRAAVRLADALVVCSADELSNLRAVEPAAEARATVLDNFTDTDRWMPGRKDPSVVTFAARLHPEKAPLLFLEAAAAVAVTHPAARFQLFGRGELEGQVAARIASLGLEQRVQRGFTTDLAPAFSRSSIFVSCQVHENLGSSSLLEAMASGNAVIATDVGQTAQIVDETVGLRVPSDAESLATAMRALLEDPERTHRLGAAARERVLARYGPGPYLAGLEHVYRRAMATRRARGALPSV